MSTKSRMKVLQAVLTVILVFVASIADAETATITLKSPNGGEILAAGSTYTISWSYTGDPEATVNLALLKAGKFSRTIKAGVAVGTAGSGLYAWKVPAAVEARSDYTIRVASATNSTITDTSNAAFSILVPSALRISAENVTISKANNALKSANLQSALDDEMAIDLIELLMSSSWSIKNKTVESSYKYPLESQVTFSTDTITVNQGGKFAAGGIITDYSSVGDPCDIVTPITYELLSNEILYIKWDIQCAGYGLVHNSSVVTVVARDKDTLTMLGSGGAGSVTPPRISILTRIVQ